MVTAVVVKRRGSNSTRGCDTVSWLSYQIKEAGEREEGGRYRAAEKRERESDAPGVFVRTWVTNESKRARRTDHFHIVSATHPVPAPSFATEANLFSSRFPSSCTDILRCCCRQWQQRRDMGGDDGWRASFPGGFNILAPRSPHFSRFVRCFLVSGRCLLWCGGERASSAPTQTIHGVQSGCEHRRGGTKAERSVYEIPAEACAVREADAPWDHRRGGGVRLQRRRWR